MDKSYKWTPVSVRNWTPHKNYPVKLANGNVLTGIAGDDMVWQVYYADGRGYEFGDNNVVVEWMDVYDVDGASPGNENKPFPLPFYPDLRDDFAGKAMQTMLRVDTDNGRYRTDDVLSRCAELSYRVADAMLKAREVGNG